MFVYLLWEVPGWNLDRLNGWSVLSFSWFFSAVLANTEMASEAMTAFLPVLLV